MLTDNRIDRQIKGKPIVPSSVNICRAVIKVILQVSWLKIGKECSTVKPVLSGHSKIDKTKILMTNGSLMKVKSIAQCSHWSSF